MARIDARPPSARPGGGRTAARPGQRGPRVRVGDTVGSGGSDGVSVGREVGRPVGSGLGLDEDGLGLGDSDGVGAAVVAGGGADRVGSGVSPGNFG